MDPQTTSLSSSANSEATMENPSLAEIVRQFLAYPFAEDATYQQGLESITSSGVFEGKSAEERDELTLRSKLFFFNRTGGQNITAEDVAKYITGAPQEVSVSLPQQENPQATSERVLTFAELTSLIQQGKTDQIPNNRHIPNIINSENPSVSTVPTRRKPWESVSAVASS